MANSSSTSAFPNSPAANTTRNVGFGSELFGRQCGGDHQLFGTNPGTGAFQNPWPYGWAGFPLSGNQQFGSQFRLGSSAASTSPFGNESPSYSSSSSTFGTISSGFRSSTTGPYTRSLGQENTSANNVSLFAPFTGSNLGISDIQGTRICSYAPTPEADDNFSSRNLISISAMPFYQEKSHEELRSEDYQLTGRTGSKFRLGSSAATTSPFGNESPSYSSSSSTFGTISSGFRSSTTGPFTRSLVKENTSANNVSVSAPFTGSNPGPFTRSLVKENTSANNVSVSAPFTGSNLGISGIQGSRICSYAPTPVVDSSYKSNMVSISAMPFYQEKSHEELRAEDYQLTESTGSSIINTNSKSSNQHNTSANTVSVFAPFTNSDKGRSGCEGTKWSCEKSPVEGKIPASNATFSISTMSFNKEKGHEELRSSGDNRFTVKTCGYATGAESSSSFPVINVSISVSPSLVSNSSSSSSTCVIPTVPLPLHHPVISIPLSIKIGHSGDLFTTSQPTNPVPTSGTVPASSNATVTESIITSLPEPVSTGGFAPRFHCSTDNRQQPISQFPVSVGQSSFMIPKLKCPEYYMEPSMDNLVANELKRPGFCRQVKDFGIGKRGYGSIKFLGETDVRNLDLESIVQFNIREVMFCMDEKAKPPVGQGLNKAAEITLLNVDCIDKNTGKQYIDGPKVDQYKQLLMRKTVDQGAEFVSFDPAKGEWKFRVQHF